MCVCQAKAKPGKKKGKKKAKAQDKKPAADTQPQAEAVSAAEAQAGDSGLARTEEADSALEAAVASEDLASIVSACLQCA